ncbi:MAG: hypothetical protein EOO02_19945, partial [Chitinophagaceae bacterium]
MAEELRKDIIVSIKTDTKDAQQGIDDVKKGLDNLNETPVDKPFKSLKTELKEANKAYYELANAIRTVEEELGEIGNQFGKTSAQYQEAENRLKGLQGQFTAAAQKSADLKDAFQEANKTIQAFNPDNKLQSLVGVAQGATGAVQGVAGAMAFLGVESDTAAETMAKLQGLMAFSDALNSVDDIKNSFKNFGQVIQQTSLFQKANAVTTNLASGAMRILGLSANATSFSFQALKTAIAATGIGLLVVAISTLLPIISNWISGTDDAEAAQKRLASAIEGVNRAF